MGLHSDSGLGEDFQHASMYMTRSDHDQPWKQESDCEGRDTDSLWGVGDGGGRPQRLPPHLATRMSYHNKQLFQTLLLNNNY